MSVVISPTIGRVVLYVPHLNEHVAKSPLNHPHAALVADVLDTGRINLAVHDSLGRPYQRESVLLVQAGEEAPADGGYACWMPYQVGQAENTAVVSDGMADRVAGLEKQIAETLKLLEGRAAMVGAVVLADADDASGIITAANTEDDAA